MTFEQRPWGMFHVLDEQPGFKVKRIRVNPGARLSLQSHRQRSEHWIVVNGIATVTVRTTVTELTCGQYIDIPQGAKHRLANAGAEAVEVIEVQFGTYLEEDDIVRYEDDYDRT